MSLSRGNPSAERAAVSGSVLSLGVELVIQINATLSELGTMTDVRIDEAVIRQLHDLLDATETLLGGTHFSGRARDALIHGDNNRGSIAAKALDTARHWLRILDALYGPKGAPQNG